MAYQKGPKELQLMALKEARLDPKKNRKPSSSDLRNNIAKIKGSGKPKRGGGRGR